MATPIPLDLSPDELERFWSRVDRRGPDECWPWTGFAMFKGYGVLMLRGKNVRAHRVAWALRQRRDPSGLFVCHTCDNPPCCNPAHLWIGTNADNARDMARKGRAAPHKRNNRHNQMEVA